MTSKEKSYSPEFDQSNVEMITIRNKYRGFFNINEYVFKHALYEGGQSQEVTREIFERGHAVAVLPYDPILDKVVFIEQIRVGAMATKASPWLLEVVAGMIDKDESKQDVAIREAKEEAGLDIKSLIPMTSYLSSPGGTTERLYLYLGLVDSSAAGGVHGLEHEQEDIKVQVLDYPVALELLSSGVIDNAASVICLQWLALNREQNLEQWKKVNGNT